MEPKCIYKWSEIYPNFETAEPQIWKRIFRMALNVTQETLIQSFQDIQDTITSRVSFPQDACFKCRDYAGSPCFLQHKHVKVHEEQCTFSDEHVLTWIEAMTNLLEIVARYLGYLSIFCVVTRCYNDEYRPSAQHQHSSLRAHLMILIETQARTLSRGKDLSSPNCPAATLNWVVFAKFFKTCPWQNSSTSSVWTSLWIYLTQLGDTSCSDLQNPPQAGRQLPIQLDCD